MFGRLRGWPFFTWLPRRSILEKLQATIDDRRASPREWVLCIQCLCAAGRHRSLASAVCVARVLEQFGACAVLVVHNWRDDRGRKFFACLGAAVLLKIFYRLGLAALLRRLVFPK